MRVVFLLVLLAGIGLATFGVIMASEMFSRDQSELRRLRAVEANMVDLEPTVVATKELRYGQILTKDMIKTVKLPAAARPKNVFSSVEELLGPEGSKPRAIIRIMEPGEIVLESKVTDFGQDAGVSSRLSRGMRAFALRVDVASGVSGFLNPGDTVDIFWSGRNDRGTITRLIQERVKLIAIDQSADGDNNRPVVARTVTVEVAPISVAALAQAQATGKLSLSLRGAEDETSAGPIEVDLNDIIGKVESIAQEERVCTIKVRKGSEVVEIPSECPEDQ